MKGYKSKDGIAAQIQRIFKNYPEHRHYMLAQRLAIKYNYNMTETPENNELHRMYMECHYSSGIVRPERKAAAEHYLAKMGSQLYPKSVYAK